MVFVALSDPQSYPDGLPQRSPIILLISGKVISGKVNTSPNLPLLRGGAAGGGVQISTWVEIFLEIS